MGGWFGMTCWNGLSEQQQRTLIERGTLNAFDPSSVPAGECQRGASVAVETIGDEAPGARFYCVRHAIEYLEEVRAGFQALDQMERTVDQR